MGIDGKIFYVLDEPYCLWDQDYKEKNLNFLNGIDPDYYSFICENIIKSEDDKRVSIG